MRVRVSYRWHLRGWFSWGLCGWVSRTRVRFWVCLVPGVKVRADGPGLADVCPVDTDDTADSSAQRSSPSNM